MFCFTFIIFSETISSTCFNNFNKTDNEKNEEIYDRDAKYYIENICHEFPDLYMPSNFQ